MSHAQLNTLLPIYLSSSAVALAGCTSFLTFYLTFCLNLHVSICSVYSTPFRPSLLACLPAYLASYVSTYLPICTAFVDLPYLSMWFYFFLCPSAGLFRSVLASAHAPKPRSAYTLDFRSVASFSAFGCGCQ